MIAYFDCFSGIAGDMVLAALIDAGAPLDRVNEAISSMGLDATVSTKVVSRSGLRGLVLDIDAGEQTVSTFRQARALLMQDALTETVRDRALQAITALARAEARIHSVSLDDVHFHEISAIDTLVDIIGSAVALESLGVDAVHTSAIALSRGWIETSHGRLPLPAPAAAELLIGIPVVESGTEEEIVTPTGAAIASSWSKGHGPMPDMSCSAVGYGAGSRELVVPNLLRVFIGEPSKDQAPDHLVQVECNIDDMNPELYPYVVDRLLDSGVLDVWITPTIAKKGRPGVLLGALAEAHLEEKVRAELFAETTTLGVRSFPVRRWTLERSFIEVSVLGHSVKVKVAWSDGKVVNLAPEYSDCSKVARSTGVSLKEVFRLATDLGGQHSGRERI